MEKDIYGLTLSGMIIDCDTYVVDGYAKKRKWVDHYAYF